MESKTEAVVLRKEDLKLLYELPSELSNSASSLRELRVEGADRLESCATRLHEFTGLEALWLESLPVLKGVHPLPQSLLTLTIIACPILQHDEPFPHGLRHLRLADMEGAQFSLHSVFHLQQLVQLSLPRLHLREVPTALSLPKLRELDLSNNHLTALPEALSTCTALETLDVSSNDLVDLPSSLGKLQALASLDLSRNSLGRLPAGFSGLTRLVTLNLKKNIFKEVPEPCTRCPVLVTLNVEHNLIERVPPSITALTGLVNLRLTGNPLYSHRADNYGRSLFKDQNALQRLRFRRGGVAKEGRALLCCYLLLF